VYRFPREGGDVVLKVFGDRHGRLDAWLKTLGNLIFERKSSTHAAARCRNERACLHLWREAGFGVFPLLDLPLPPPWDRLALAFEFVEGRLLRDLLEDPALPATEKEHLLRRLFAECSRRHRLAVERREPALIHEHGHGRHVMVVGLPPLAESEPALLWFDLEVSWTRRRGVIDLVGRELLGLLKSVRKSVGVGAFPHYLGVALEAYDFDEALRRARDLLHRHPNPVVRWVRRIERCLKARKRKPTSIFAMADLLGEALAEEGTREVP
jgi:hypothetical protein